MVLNGKVRVAMSMMASSLTIGCMKEVSAFAIFTTTASSKYWRGVIP